MNTASTLVILYCISTAVAIAVRRLRVPFTVALVIVGLALGSFHLVDAPDLTQELLFTFFLPGLLFEAAFHLQLDAFRKVWRLAVGFAVPGVMIAAGITAALVVLAGRALGLGLDMKLGLVFAGLVAATDPVAVTALFRELRAPARLCTLVEAESLFNDGIAVVLLSLIVGYALGAQTSVPLIALELALVAGGGVVAGILVGWTISMVIRRVNEPVIEIGLTVIAAYGSFVLADRVHASGVLATVVAGMMCGRQGRDLGMSSASRAAVESFWEYVAFALNSIVFLLLGLQFDALRLAAVWPAVLIAFVIMVVARAAIVFGTIVLQRAKHERLPWSWGAVVTLGGLRGALSVVLALALPHTLPQRDLIATMTVGVVLVSIVVQGLAMRVVVQTLRIADGGVR